MSLKAHLRELTREDYRVLVPIFKQELPFGDKLRDERILADLSASEGWAVVDSDSGEVVGAVTINGLCPLHYCTIHAAIKREYWGAWRSEQDLRMVYRHLFVTLDLVKVKSYAIYGVTYHAAKCLDSMGFKVEGIDRCGGRTPDGKVFDVVLYGLLREECKWITE